MKRILSSLALLGIAAPAVFGASLTTFRVCEEKRTLKTSDGADAGHMEYIVVDPAEQRVVSAVVTGGVVGQKFVTVPFSTVQYGSGSEVVLERIDRQRLVSAPVIEERYLTSGAVIEPAVISKSYSYFGVEPHFTGAVRVDANREVNRSTTNVDRSTTNINESRGQEMRDRNGRPEANVSTENGADASTRSSKRAGNKNAAEPGSKGSANEANGVNPAATTNDSPDSNAKGSTKGKMNKTERDAETVEKNTPKADTSAEKPAEKSQRSKADENSNRKTGNTPEEANPATTEAPAKSSKTGSAREGAPGTTPSTTTSEASEKTPGSSTKASDSKRSNSAHADGTTGSTTQSPDAKKKAEQQ